MTPNQANTLEHSVNILETVLINKFAFYVSYVSEITFVTRLRTLQLLSFECVFLKTLLFKQNWSKQGSYILSQ